MSSLFGGGGTGSTTGGSSLFGGAAAASNGTAGKTLFDRVTPATTNSAAPTSSLFGAAPAASGTQQQGGIFGGQPGGSAVQPAASGSNLFGALGSGAQAPATSAPSLFGGPRGVAQPAANSGGSSMFGGAAAKPASGGLFSGNTAQPVQSSLFGGQAATTTPASNSLFGPANTGQAQQGTSLFGPKTDTNQQQLQQSVAPEAPLANPSYFNQLLERGKKRQTEDNLTQFGELPALELGLADISRKVRNLGQGGPSAGLARGGDARAQYLLAASGVNTGQALRDLERLADGTSGQPALSDQVADAVTDVKLDLSRKHYNDFQTLVDSRVKRAQDDFNQMIEEQLHDVDWAAQTQRIYEHFGLRKPQELEQDHRSSFAPAESGGFGRSNRKSKFGATATNGRSFGVPGLARSIIGTPGTAGMRESQFGGVGGSERTRLAPEDRVLRLKQDKYSARVKDLNVARLTGKPFPILDRFASVEADPSGEDNSMLLNAYRALGRIVGEDVTKESLSEPGALKPRHYARDYLAETSTSPGAVAIRKRIIDGSRAFLEEQYTREVHATVTKNPREASIGGVPTNLAMIKGFTRFKALRKELGADIETLQQIADDYCWVLIYHLLRCGLVNDALAYVEENSAAFRNIDRRFIGYLRAYVQSPDHRLPPQQQSDINNDYTQRAKLAPDDSIDPYRMVCYKIIGRCDILRRNLERINSDMMDWMWLQFVMAREYSRVDEYSHEAFGLEELRNSFKEIGQRYFTGTSDIPNAPTTFFFMQILAGTFEKAVADLYANNYISATHFAIALDYYGLLRVSDFSNSDELLTTTTRQQAQIAFASMVGLYTRDFRTADSTSAVDYIALVCLNADLDGDLGKSQRELCHQALTELVLETRDFASLLGDIRTDGQRIPGSIDSRLSLIGLDSEEDFMRHITLVAARTAEDQNRTTDAALLFHLAQDYDRVMNIINAAVSQALTTELGEQPQKLTPLRPRQQDDQQAAQGSLSLTAVDDPVQLAANFRSLYFSSHQYSSKINVLTRDSCNVLLLLAEARNALETGQWANAIDYIRTADILPLSTASNMTAIRAKAETFNRSPPVLAATIGHAMLWAMIGLANQVAHLRSMEIRTDANGNLIDTFRGMAKDVMVFAGLIKYKLPGRVWEMLAGAGREMGCV